MDVQPRLLQVAQGARGVVTLGDGLTVSMYAAGLRVQRQDQVAFETVVQGSLVSAARGHLEGRGADRREHLDATLDNVRIDSVEVSARGATYRGVVFDDERHSLPLTLTASRVGQRVDLRVTVPGADLVVLHAARQPLTVGHPAAAARVATCANGSGGPLRRPAPTSRRSRRSSATRWGSTPTPPPPWTCGRSGATKYTCGARRCACRSSRTARVRIARSDA